MIRIFQMILIGWAMAGLAANPAFAQAEVKGKVFDAQTKEPLAEINVQIPNTTEGTSTDAQGRFSLSTPSQTLVISGLGYQKQEVSVTGASVSVSLEPSIENLQAVIVTASRESQKRTEAPIAITKLSPTLINDTKATNIYEVINKTPGVVMLNYNNEQHGMSIRQPMGTSAYFLYLEDGVPTRPMGVFNHNALIEMNVLAVSSVEVIKGPASSLYGPEAVGGAINFITQKPTSVPVARIGIQGDQFGYKRVQFGTGGYVTPKLGLYAGGFLGRAAQQLANPQRLRQGVAQCPGRLPLFVPNAIDCRPFLQCLQVPDRRQCGQPRLLYPRLQLSHGLYLPESHFPALPPDAEPPVGNWLRELCDGFLPLQ
jgi:hypothetical protein